VLGVVAKVVWEQAFGSSMGTEQLIHARVATEAHLAGVIGGLGLAYMAKQWRWKI
ncbi:rhombosortase, partial [Vibrio fluvialis]|nr:rhombosortase [Vibrio fluvialis]